MKKLLIACAAAALGVGLATSAGAATVVYDFSSPTGTLGTSQTYTASSLTITAKGYDSSNTATDLFGKAGGGDENGLGLNNDSTGQGEIAYGKGYVQLDVSSLFGHATNVGFTTGSSTSGETWAVYGSNSNGVCGSGYAASGCGVALASATTESQGSAILLPNFGTYTYYDFVEISNNGGDAPNNNFLLTNLTGTLAAVPEPSTWAMMVLGVGMVGFGLRRRQKDAAALA